MTPLVCVQGPYQGPCCRGSKFRQGHLLIVSWGVPRTHGIGKHFSELNLNMLRSLASGIVVKWSNHWNYTCVSNTMLKTEGEIQNELYVYSQSQLPNIHSDIWVGIDMQYDIKKLDFWYQRGDCPQNEEVIPALSQICLPHMYFCL